VVPDPMMLEALKRVAAALKLLKQAKRRGVDVKPARPLVKQCARALKSKDYASAIRLAEEVASPGAATRTSRTRTGSGSSSPNSGEGRTD